jgi:hypothetical protein
MWGSPPINIPENVVCKWGARAIKEKEGFSFCPDRKSFEGEDDKGFSDWLNKTLNKAREWATHQSPSGSAVLTIEEDKYKYQATCNGSYGYVYMAAWKHS